VRVVQSRELAVGPEAATGSVECCELLGHGSAGGDRSPLVDCRHRDRRAEGVEACGHEPPEEATGGADDCAGALAGALGDAWDCTGTSAGAVCAAVVLCVGFVVLLALLLGSAFAATPAMPAASAPAPTTTVVVVRRRRRTALSRAAVRFARCRRFCMRPMAPARDESPMILG
jgi:hypothetical protein